MCGNSLILKKLKLFNLGQTIQLAGLTPRPRPPPLPAPASVCPLTVGANPVPLHAGFNPPDPADGGIIISIPSTGLPICFSTHL